jgi:hypothetical protein
VRPVTAVHNRTDGSCIWNHRLPVEGHSRRPCLIDVCPFEHQLPCSANRVTDRYTMMRNAKLVLGMIVALAVVLLGGWVWGASGNGERARTLAASALRGDRLEARNAVLTARLDLYDVNFGEASRHLENARAPLRRAEEQLKSLGREGDLKRLQPASTRIDEAQRLARQLDQGANARGAEAAQIAGISRVSR